MKHSLQSQAAALARAIDMLDELAPDGLGDMAMALAAALDTLREMAVPVEVGDFVGFPDGFAGKVLAIENRFITFQVPERHNGKDYFVANRADAMKLMAAAEPNEVKR